MDLQFFQVDVFTSERFGGNPLAVFPDGRAVDDITMQKIAREMNLSETTFVLPATDSKAAARVRIFTPGNELPFAGHPTLGTAFVLHRLGMIRDERFAFEMKIGLVNVRKDGDRFWMEPPPPQATPAVCTAAQAAITLALPARACLRDPVVVGVGALRFLMVLLNSKESVDAIASVDRNALKSAAGQQVADGDVLAFAYGNGHAYSRMFPHPASGIMEDPATGSSVAPLCLALGVYGVLEPQTDAIVVEQGTKMGRRSLLHARFAQVAGTITGVTVGGSSVDVLHGVLSL